MLGQGDGFYAALGLANQMDGTRTDGFDKRNGFGLVDAFQQTVYVHQRKAFTTPLLSEAKSDRNTEQFTKKKSRCQRGGVRGVANQHATTERTTL